MKSICCIATITLLSSCGWSAPISEDWAALRREVSEMRLSLAHDGAYAFVTNAATPKTVPHIHSQCWVDLLPGGEIGRRMYEQEKRDFGLDVLGHLEEYVQNIEDKEDLAGQRESAAELLAIAEWLSTSPGYGNYLLKRWAEIMALIRVGHLAVSGRVGLEEIKSYFNRIDTPLEDLKLRVRILNEEAPHKYFLPISLSSEEAGSESICRQWAKHMQESMQHYSKWCQEKSRCYSDLEFAAVVRDDPRYSFYVEDSLDGSHTLRDAWGKKTHYTSLCTGPMSMLHWQCLKEIIGYWEVAGELPLPDKELVRRPGSFKGLCREGDEYRVIIAAKWKAASKSGVPTGIDGRVIALMRDEIVDRITENCRRNTSLR